MFGRFSSGCGSLLVWFLMYDVIFTYFLFLDSSFHEGGAEVEQNTQTRRLDGVINVSTFFLKKTKVIPYVPLVDWRLPLFFFMLFSRTVFAQIPTLVDTIYTDLRDSLF